MEPRASADLRKGFELLDLDGGIGWELLTSMVRYKARQRISAKAALAHPYFDRQGLLALSVMQNLRMQYFRATQQDYSEAANWVIQLMAKSGTEKDGGFTETQLQELRVRCQAKLFEHLKTCKFVELPKFDVYLFRFCIFTGERASKESKCTKKRTRISTPASEEACEDGCRNYGRDNRRPQDRVVEPMDPQRGVRTDCTNRIIVMPIV